ncbi:MAG: hypothetical protein Q9221_003276 [Calogaya cf. arnoldii]
MALCRVCHVLHDLVITKLYEVVEITYQAYNPIHPVQLILFLRTILHKPQRAPHVRRFYLKPVLSPGWQDYDSRLDHNTQQLARMALAHCKHPLLTQMITTLGSGGEDTIDAIVSLLILLLSRLQIVQLDYFFRPWSRPDHCTHDAEIIEHLNNTPSKYRIEDLRFLRERYMVHHGESTSVECTVPPLFDPLRLFCLPDIQSIECQVMEYCPIFRWPISAPFQPTLTTLKLRFSCMRPQTLKEVLLTTPDLRILEYHHAANIDSTIALDGHKVLNCRDLCRAIDTVSLTLTELTLSIEFYALDRTEESDGDHIEWGIWESLGSMSNYKKLKTLHLPFVMLLGWNADTSTTLDKLLPWDLSELGLSSDMTGWNIWDWTGDAVVQHVASFLQIRRGYLEKFSLREDSGVGLLGAHQRATIKTLCRETGIEFDWVKSQYDK